MSRDIHLRIPEAEYADIARFAEADNRTVSNLLLHAVRAHMRRRAAKVDGAPRRARRPSGAETAQEGALPVRAEASNAESEP